jgi:type IV secretory pathway VirB2 component (pilin)
LVVAQNAAREKNPLGINEMLQNVLDGPFAFGVAVM